MRLLVQNSPYGSRLSVVPLSTMTCGPGFDVWFSWVLFQTKASGLMV